MPYIDELNEYLTNNFPDVPLEPPLFYNAPIGIRFELGVAYKGIKDEKYLRNACLRATMIFQAVFPKDEEIYVVVNSYKSIPPYKCLKIGVNVFPDYLKNKKLGKECETVETEKHYEENGDLSGISYLSCLKCKPDDLKYQDILKGIANQDFCIKPYISDGVYFISPISHIICHMYDDRGLDLIAKERNVLLPVHEKFYDWVLGYDRDRINRALNLIKDIIKKPE